MTYFWLGYAHARGKNVIPITIASEDADGKQKIDDLAFDVRAQRHMTFDRKRPELLRDQLKRTLHEMIEADYPEWYRRRFWSEVLENAEAFRS